MIRVVYIGDGVHAAGWRLAGVETRAADDATTLRALLTKLDPARLDLILIEAACADWLDPAEAQALQARLRPLCLLLPDDLTQTPDLLQRVRAQLGMSA